MRKFIYTLALIFICLPVYADLEHYDVKLENYSSFSRITKNSDCPKDKPLFPKMEILEYPRLIDVYTNLRLKGELSPLKLLKMMEEYPEFKELSLCLSKKERCPQVDTVLKEAEQIKQENKAITTQNQKIEEATKKKNAEIKAYNEALTEEKNKFEKYQRILRKISFNILDCLEPPGIIRGWRDLLGRIKDIEPLEEKTISTLEERWKHYLNKIEYVKNRNISLRKDNESVLKENIAIENENRKIELKNQRIQAKNDLLLKALNMYFTPEYLDRLSKDYETILKKHCISCDNPMVFSDMYEDDCNICQNREFIPDKPNDKYSRGKCQSKDKNGENIQVLGK